MYRSEKRISPQPIYTLHQAFDGMIDGMTPTIMITVGITRHDTLRHAELLSVDGRYFRELGVMDEECRQGASSDDYGVVCQLPDRYKGIRGGIWEEREYLVQVHVNTTHNTVSLVKTIDLYRIMTYQLASHAARTTSFMHHSTPTVQSDSWQSYPMPGSPSTGSCDTLLEMTEYVAFRYNALCLH